MCYVGMLTFVVIGALSVMGVATASSVAVSELADSSVDVGVRPWVKSDDYWHTYFDLTAEIKVALEKDGLTIPFPQRDVHLKNGAVAGATK